MDNKEFQRYKKNILDECYRIINLCLGNIPGEFAWTFKDKKKEKIYTAHTFYNSTIKPLIDLTEFVSICNFPIEKYNQLIAVEYLHNIIHEDDTDLKHKITNLYLNLDIKTFKEAVFKSITHKTGVWFACDVGQFWINRGTILDQNSSNLKDMFDVEFTLNKKAGLETRTNVPNHAMVIVGCQKNDDGFKRWKVENSHGTESILKGFITMSDNWFDDYVICAAVHINSLPLKMRALVKSKKNIKWLPYYSPMGIFAD
jgi:bleomycin hydrolase